MSRNNNKNSSSTLRRTATFLAHSALFLTSLLPAGAMAADKPVTDFDEEARWFQVELILFSHRTDLALDAEQWPDIEGLTLPEKLLELHMPEPLAATDDDVTTGADVEEDPELETEAAIPEPATNGGSDMPVAYQILPTDQLQLTGMAEKLDRSNDRELLLHIAWQQPTYDRKNAVPVYFEAGMAEPLPTLSESETATDASPTPMLSAPEYATEEDLKIGPVNPQFAGTVTLSVERYLHIATDLIYRQAVTQHSAKPIPDLDLWYDRPYPTLQEPQGPAFQQTSWQAVRGFQLKESRRMRSKEIHYLDHPFMGMVVVITPVELPEPAEEIQQTSPQNILMTPSRVRTTP